MPWSESESKQDLIDFGIDAYSDILLVLFAVNLMQDLASTICYVESNASRIHVSGKRPDLKRPVPTGVASAFTYS